MSDNEDLRVNLKKACELALIGNYDESEVFYSSVIYSLDYCKKNESEEGDRQLTEAMAMLTQEYEQVKALLPVLKMTLVSPGLLQLDKIFNDYNYNYLTIGILMIAIRIASQILSKESLEL